MLKRLHHLNLNAVYEVCGPITRVMTMSFFLLVQTKKSWCSLLTSQYSS